ncbi:MAG: hypothetical protein MZW92_36790 [Comamonadaceae bacterium]|nr:hypothetical protein [Comamonadaceae bacterium]
MPRWYGAGMTDRGHLRHQRERRHLLALAGQPAGGRPATARCSRSCATARRPRPRWRRSAPHRPTAACRPAGRNTACGATSRPAATPCPTASAPCCAASRGAARAGCAARSTSIRPSGRGSSGPGAPRRRRRRAPGPTTWTSTTARRR